MLEGRAPDGNGLVLPQGFTARVVAEGGKPVAGTDLIWPLFPDGKGSFPTRDGGWLLTCNHELYDFQTPSGNSGGASTIQFAGDGRIIGAWPVLEGSHSNSRGGATPWATWLSCQEVHGPAGGDGNGLIWECDPTGERPPKPRPALGVRTHGSVAVDSEGGHCYMTEAHRDGRLYRFSLASQGFDALTDGLLEAMVVDPDGGVSWIPVPDPSASFVPTRQQAAEGMVTPVGGGVAVQTGKLWFTTGIDDRVHQVDLRSNHYRLIWDGRGQRFPLAGIGDLTVGVSGDLFVAEDRGDMEIVVVAPEGGVQTFCRMVGDGHRLSAVTGPCFDPLGNRLYVSSLRGRGEALVRDVVPDLDWGDGVEGRHVGITYEITGPFDTTYSSPAVEVGGAVTTTTAGGSKLPETTTSLQQVGSVSVEKPSPTTGGAYTPAPEDSLEDENKGGDVMRPLGFGAAAALAVSGATIALRRRKGRSAEEN